MLGMAMAVRFSIPYGAWLCWSCSTHGRPGVMSWSRSGAPLSLMACAVRDGRLVEVVALVDPARLATMNLPPVDPRTSP
jgi:hypothetical protein